MKLFSFLLAGMTMLVIGNQVHCTTITWTNTSGGNWSAANNWSPNQVPTNTDNVLITKPGTYTVTFDFSLNNYAPTNVANLTLGAGGGAAGMQTLNMATNTFNVGSLWLVTGGGVVMASGSDVAAKSATMVANGGVLNLFFTTVQSLLIVTNGGIINSTNGTFEVVTVASNGILNSRMDSLGGGAFTVANGGVLNEYKLEIGLAGPAVSLTVASGGVMNLLEGPAIYPFNVGALDGPLTNYGTINMTNTGFLIGYGSGRGGIMNEPGGVINLRGVANIAGTTGEDGDFTYFINKGNVIETAGAGSTVSVSSFDNSQGAITNLSGTLVLESLTNLLGTYSAGTGATIQLAGGGSVLTPGSPLVLADNGQYQFFGSLYLPNNTVPNLMLVGGVLELGPDFQGGAITNLVLDGITLSNTLPVKGIFAVTNSQIAGNFTVGSGGIFSEQNAYLYGAVTVANGGTFNLNGGTELLPLMAFAGGTINLTGNITLNEALTNTGTVNFNDSLIGLYTGIINQSGGLMNFSGSSNTITYAINGLDEYYIVSQYFINHGKVVQNSPSGTNIIALVSVDSDQGILTNLAGTSVLETIQTNLTGTYYASPGASIQFTAASSATNPITTGTPLVLAGSGQYQLTSSYIFLPTNVPANLTLFGTVLELGPGFQGGAITNLAFGAMTLTNTLPVKGSFTATNQSTLYGNFTVANDGVFNDGATVNGALTVANGGLMTVVGSALMNSNSSLTLASGGALNITGGGITLDGPLTNSGTINITNPPGGFNSGMTLVNNGSANLRGGVINKVSGLINLGSDNADISGYFGGFEYLSNQGRIMKSAGTSYSEMEVTFTTNSGAITAQSGGIVLLPFITQTGGSLNVALNNATNYGSVIVDYFPVNPNVSSNIVLGGAFNATLANGYVPTSGTAFNVLWVYSGSYSRTFGSLGLPAATAWQSSYGKTNFTIIAGGGSPKFATLNLSGTNLLFNGTGGTAGTDYVILESTNLALPRTNWTALITNKFDSGGQFRYTNHVNPAKSRQFFIFKLP